MMADLPLAQLRTGVHCFGSYVIKIGLNAFLLALSGFIACRGTPLEILSQREPKEAFAAMEPQLQEKLAKQQIKFQFNPLAAPHFGGTWEHEIQSLKKAL